MEVEVERELEADDKKGVDDDDDDGGMTHTGRAVFKPRGEASFRKSSLDKSSYM